jgi:dTDP-4-dehydrorhamnose reductase
MISFFNINSYDVIINCAAMTEVENAETDGKKNANQVNHIAVSKLALIAKKQGFKIIHISTDYVFDGRSNKPYKEDDAVNPLNVYGQTKLDGEKAIRKILPHGSLIIRTSGLYSMYGRNFLTSMLSMSNTNKKLKVVNDQISAPTLARDLAEAIITILNSKKFFMQNLETQIYHYCSSEGISWYEFAKIIFNSAQIKIKIQPCTAEELLSSVKRPIFSQLDTKKISNDFNVKIFHAENSVRNLFDLKKNI